MKLKRKLISLSLLVSALTSFCAFGNVAKAAVRGGTFEENMKQAEMMFYKDGLQNCKNKPLFGAVAHIGSKRTDVSDPSSINVYVSPTELMRRYPSLKEYLDNDNSVLDYEIEDSNGVVYRTKKPFPYNPAYDYLIVYISSREIPNKNFKIAAGEEYKIRLYDSNGDLVVEDSFKTKEGVFEEIEQIHKKIAHPPKFDGSLCEKLFKRFCGKSNVGVNKEKRSVSSAAADAAASKNINKECGYAFCKSELKKTSSQEMLDMSKKLFYEKKLNCCYDKPICCGFVSDNADSSRNDFTLLFSPTYLLEKFPNVKDLNSLSYKIKDENGLSCCFTNSDVEINPFRDVCSAYVPSVYAIRKKGGSYFGETISVDDGFKFEAGKSYNIKIYDSAENLLVDESFAPVNFGSIYSFALIQQIAHPKKFNESFYSNLIVKDKKKIKKIAENDGLLGSNNEKSSVLVNRSDVAKTSASGSLAKYKNSYYKNKYDKLNNKPKFLGVVTSADEIRGNEMSFWFSPTMLASLDPSVSDMRNITFKITDSKGRVYSFKELKLWPNLMSDMVYIFVPSVKDIEEMESFKKAEEGFKVDRGFKMVPGERYKVSVYNSAGRLIVEDSFSAGHLVDGKILVKGKQSEEGMAGSIAHHKTFNDSLYRKILKDRGKAKAESSERLVGSVSMKN